MGRGSDDSVQSGRPRSRKQSPESLSIGQDLNGQKVSLGQKDSTGMVINFISQDGACWASIAEHDEVQTLGAFEEEMIAWQRGERADGQPKAREVAEEICLDPENIEEVALLAEENWERTAARQRRLIAERGDNFREDLEDLPSQRYPLSQDGRHQSYPSRIKGAAINLMRLSETEEEREEAVRRIVEINDRMSQFGFEPLSDDLIEAIANEDDRLFSPVGGRETDEDEMRAAFEAIVSDLKPETEPVIVWSSSLDIPFGSHGDGISLESKREGEKGALEAGLQLEERVAGGALSQEDVLLKVIATPINPEEEKLHALDILAEGESHPFVRRAAVLGIAPEKILEKAQSVAMGQGERALFVAQATVFDQDLGQVEVTVSGETAEEVARRARTILPGARYFQE